MSEQFNINRWLLLVRKHWNENGKRYVLSALAVAALLLSFYLVTMLTGIPKVHTEQQTAFYFMGLFITGCTFAGYIFHDLVRKPRAINYLLLPASHLEKMLCAFLFGVILFFLVYTGVYYVVDWVVVKVGNGIAFDKWIREGNDAAQFQPSRLINIFISENHRRDPALDNENLIFLFGFFGVQSAFALGSIYFEKFGIVKTAVALLVLAVFLSLFIGKLLPVFSPAGDSRTFLQNWTLAGEEGHRIVLPQIWRDIFSGFLRFAIAPILWVVVYFRLKEKTV